MSIFSKIISRKESAVSIWRDHYASVKTRLQDQERAVRRLYDNLISEEATANAELAADPTTATVVKSIDVTARRLAAERSMAVFNATFQIEDRIEKALNPKLLKAAIKEAWKMFEDEKAKAAEDLDRMASNHGCPVMSS